ncbi:MAG TPA: hypothetical protein VM012_14200 [Flavitalea sp.]|nr:hypothetical protein [Flavitalea sp.]
MSFYDKILLITRYGLSRTVNLSAYIIALIRNRIFSFDSVYRYVRLIIFDLAIIQYQKEFQTDVVLLDQWIIQELWSVTIFRMKSYNRISKEISKFYFRTDAVFYLDVDVNTATERISRRSTTFSRFDRMDKATRAKELLKYKSYLYQLYENSNCKQKHLFTTYRSPEKNAALFVKHLQMPFSYS